MVDGHLEIFNQLSEKIHFPHLSQRMFNEAEITITLYETHFLIRRSLTKVITNQV